LERIHGWKIRRVRFTGYIGEARCIDCNPVRELAIVPSQVRGIDQMQSVWRQFRHEYVLIPRETRLKRPSGHWKVRGVGRARDVDVPQGVQRPSVRTVVRLATEKGRKGHDWVDYQRLRMIVGR